MRRHLKIFYRIYSARLGKDLSLPLFNQFFQIIGSLCFFLLHLYSFGLLIGKFSFPGWTRSDMWVLLFTFEIFTYLAFYLYWRGFNYTVRDINSGSFDMTLTKPVTSRLLTFFRGGGFHNIFCTLLGLVFLMGAFIYFQIPFSFQGLALYLLSLVSGLWIMYCWGVSFISLNLKYGNLKSTISAVFQVQEAYKYPSTAYDKLSLGFWIILSSLSLLTTFPATLLLSKPLEFKLVVLYILVLIFSTVIAHLTWSLGLRHYSSASS